MYKKILCHLRHNVKLLLLIATLIICIKALLFPNSMDILILLLLILVLLGLA